MSRKKSLYRHRCCWIFGLASVAIYVIVLWFVWRMWDATMLNGEPGIASDMLLSDRLLRNTQFRNYTMSWCSLLGGLAVVFYISYWLSQWLEYDDVNLKANSRELRCLLLSTQTAMSLAYVQNTFVHSPSTQATWGAVFFIADIILGLIALWAALKEIVRISKKRNKNRKGQSAFDKKYNEIDHALGWIDHDNRPLVIVLVVLYAVPPIFSGGVQIMNLITQFAELKDIFPRLFVQQPYTLTTPYDYFVAGVPFLLCLLLETNLKYNAPPKIGMPYVYGKRGNVYTLAKLRHESREGHAA